MGRRWSERRRTMKSKNQKRCVKFRGNDHLEVDGEELEGERRTGERTDSPIEELLLEPDWGIKGEW